MFSFRFRILAYLIIIILFSYSRWSMDKDYMFLTSDGQIKFFQAYGHYKQGFGNFECFYPALDIDPNFQYFIFDYPWGFVHNVNNSKCVFQYPPFFSYIGTILLHLSNVKVLMYIALFLYIFCMILYDRILKRLSVSDIGTLLGVIVVFGISFVPLTIQDFSEMSLYHLLLIGCLYLLLSIYQREKSILSDSIVFYFIGFLVVLNVFIRTEIALLVILLFLSILLFSNFRPFFRSMILFTVLGAIIPIILIFLFNYLSVDHILGMRGYTVLNDTLDKDRTGLFYHLRIAKGYLISDEEMIGILPAFPGILLALVLFVPLIFVKLPEFIRVTLVSGFMYIILGSLLTPVKGGVQNFGLRYLETGFIPLMIGIIYGLDEFWKDKTQIIKISLIGLILALSYPAYKFMRTGLNTLTSSSRWFAKVQNYFTEVGNGYIVHESYNTPYMVGPSYINQKHIYVESDLEMAKVEKKFLDKKVSKFMILHFDAEPYISINVPKSIHHRHYTKLKYIPQHYKKLKEEKILHFRMSYYELQN